MGEFTEMLTDFGNTTIDGSLDFDFDVGDLSETMNNMQEWGDTANMVGEPSSSSPSDPDTVMSNNTPQPELSSAREKAGLKLEDVCYGMVGTPRRWPCKKPNFDPQAALHSV